MSNAPASSIAYRCGVVSEHIGRLLAVYVLFNAINKVFIKQTMTVSALDVILVMAIVYIPFRVVRYILSGD